jgi:hypothetical protein
MTPTITDFINNTEYLGLPQRGITLYPVQILALKLLYSQELTDAEDQLCEQFGVEPQPHVLEMALVWGRRTGKNLMAALIALYEAAKTITEPADEAYSCQPIVLVISPSIEQSKIIRRDILSNVGRFFEVRTSGDRIILNKNQHEAVIRCTSAGSNSIIGTDCSCLLLDDPAAFKRGSDKHITECMLPVLRTRKYSKLVLMGTPRRKGDVLHGMYSVPKPGRIAMRLPTWIVNIRHCKESLRGVAIEMSDNEFDRDFGAVFPETDPDLTEQITLRMPSYLVDKLKIRAKEESSKNNWNISYTDVIRQILEDSVN